MAIYFKDKSK